MHDSGFIKKQQPKKRKAVIPPKTSIKIQVQKSNKDIVKTLAKDTDVNIQETPCNNNADKDQRKPILKPIESAFADHVEHKPHGFSHIQESYVPQPTNYFQSHSTPIIETANEDVISHFIKGECYLWGDGRVMECMGFRGKKERRVGFEDYGLLEYFPKKREQDPDYYQWFGIRIDNGVEICDRGRIRADKIATKQQAKDYTAIRKEIEDGERAYWAERKAKRERDAKRLEELEKIVKENGLEG